MKKRISVTMDEQLFITFQDFCTENGMKISSKIELIVRDFLRPNGQNRQNGDRSLKK